MGVSVDVGLGVGLGVGMSVGVGDSVDVGVSVGMGVSVGIGWMLGECWVDVGGLSRWMLGLLLGWLCRVHMLLRNRTVIDLHILALYQHP